MAISSPHSLRRTSWADQLLAEANRALQVLSGVAHASRPNPADAAPPSVSAPSAPVAAVATSTAAVPATAPATNPALHAHAAPAAAAATGSASGVSEGSLADSADTKELTAAQRDYAARLMRVNHVGEICAQALYRGQASLTRDQHTRKLLEQAAQEEVDHLAWLNQRIRELNGRPSLLNPVWYAGSFALGVLAGRAGTPYNLGFMAETERQVGQHLDSHLDKLPANDVRSRAIVEQMRLDEAGHQRQAEQSGGKPLPAPVRLAMRGMSKVMTTTAHWV